MIAIDPGITGAIARISQSGAYEVKDLPVMEHGKGKAKVKKQINPSGLRDILEIYYREGETIVIERISSMPGQGVATMFSMGDTFGCIRGVCAAMGFKVQIITPQSWKKYYGLGKDKEVCRAKAIELFPKAELSRKKDHNRAEALLMANYGKEVFK